jgi:hypothetical protein
MNAGTHGRPRTMLERARVATKHGSVIGRAAACRSCAPPVQRLLAEASKAALACTLQTADWRPRGSSPSQIIADGELARLDHILLQAPAHPLRSANNFSPLHADCAAISGRTSTSTARPCSILLRARRKASPNMPSPYLPPARPARAGSSAPPRATTTRKMAMATRGRRRAVTRP